MSKPTTTRKMPSLPCKLRWTPPPYQKKALKYLLNHFSAALLLDPGLGKTSITLAACKVLKKERTMTGTLVVAPLRPATTTWPDEIGKWADFADMTYTSLHGDKFSQRCREDHDFYIINYEGLAKLFTRRKVGKVWKYELTADGKEILKRCNALVWDELSKMKNSDALRYKLIKPWLKKFLIKWGLTGTPASNGLEDLFGQCYVLDEGRTLGQFITHYRADYFVPAKSGFGYVVAAGQEKAIYARLKPLALRMEAADYLKLPQQLDHAIRYELPPAVRAQYDEMEEELLTTVDDDLIVATNAGAANGKCRQICSGALYLHDYDLLTGAPKPRRKSERQWVVLHDDKLDLLQELVDELQGQQLLVAYEFEHDLQRLLERFPGTPHIGGGVSTKRGAELEALWNAKELPLMFVQPAAVAHGLNLQKSHAQHIAWFTLTWDLELYIQLNARLKRQGNNAEHMHVYHFVCKDSVEESVYYAIRRKDRDQKKLLEALKEKKRETRSAIA